MPWKLTLVASASVRRIRACEALVSPAHEEALGGSRLGVCAICCVSKCDASRVAMKRLRGESVQGGAGLRAGVTGCLW